jgi:hypothetical protein
VSSLLLRNTCWAHPVIIAIARFLNLYTVST